MKRFIMCAIVVVLGCGLLSAQQYKKVKVTTTEGFVEKGKKGILTNESFTFLSGTESKTYTLDQLQMVQAKEGKAGKWALGFGGGCAGLVLISGIAAGSGGIADAGGTTGTYIVGGLIWTGLFAGVGALIGVLVDDYETVYLKGTASRMMQNLKLNVYSNQFTNYNVGLTYSIPINSY